MFLIKRQLLAKEQHLGAQRRPGRNGQSQELDTLCACSSINFHGLLMRSVRTNGIPNSGLTFESIAYRVIYYFFNQFVPRFSSIVVRSAPFVNPS